MPRAFDLRQPQQDYSPLSNLLDFSNIDQTVELAGSLIKGYLDSLLDTVVDVIFELTGIDLSEFLPAAKAAIAALTFDVSGLQALVGQVIDAIVQAMTGSTSTGNDLSAVISGLVNGVLQVPGQLLDGMLGLLAGLQAQVTAMQNNPGGASQSDDFGSVGVTGWTNVLNAIAVSARGPYIQTPTVTAGYIGTTGTPRRPATDRHGAQIVVDAKMHGAARLWIAGDATMSNYAALEVYSGFDGDAMRIVSGSSPTVTVARKQTDFLTTPLSNLTAFDIKYDTAANKFIALRNGQNVGLEWIDTGNTVTHGASKRTVGVVSNANNGTADGAYGFGIKKVTFYDW